MLPYFQATTTPLVRETFEDYNFFANQLAGHSGPKRRRCGVCEVCQLPDCGECSHCKDMLKFGGSGRSKQACVRRRCPNMAVEVAEDDDGGDVLEADTAEVAKKVPKISCRKTKKAKVEWVGEPEVKGDRQCFSCALVNGVEVSLGQGWARMQ